MSADGMIFYKSFQKAIKTLPKREQLKALWAIIDYALDGDEPVDLGSAEGVFILAKPQIDANNKRRANGAKGGRPKNQTETKQKPKANQTQNQTETKAEPKEKEKEKEKVKDKEKIKKEKAEKITLGERGNVRLTEKELERLRNDYGEPRATAAIEYLDAYIADKKYKSQEHNLALRRWVFDALKEQEERRQKQTRAVQKQTKFHNFREHGYEYNDLERQMLASRPVG